MLKSLTYNKQKKYQLILTLVTLSLFVISFALSQHLSWGLIISMRFAGLALYTIVLIFDFRKKGIITDELSRANESKAMTFTFFVTSFSIITMMIVTIFFEIEITLSFDILFCIFLFLFCIKDGFYLYFEREGNDYAGSDNED